MLIEVKDVNTFFGTVHALHDISFTVDEGESVALLGRNGMGKSTTLKSIMGLVKPRSGSIKFKGNEIVNDTPHKTARVGIAYVPEERRIFPNLSVLDNLKIGIKAGEKREIKAENRWSYERVYRHFPILEDRTHQKGTSLSGGEQQMLAIARSLMGNPDLLLIDEPTEGLAPVMVAEVRDILSEIVTAGVAIFVVEHNLKVALSLADRLYLMGKGCIGFEGAPEDLETSPEIKRKYLEV